MGGTLRVLFVVKSNSLVFEKAPFIQIQMESLKEQGIAVSCFQVTGKGISGYLKSRHQLRDYFKKNDFDLIHAHYSLCGWTAVLAFPGKPIVLSLMGSDALGEFTGPNKTTLKSKFVILLTLLIQPFVKAIISKSYNINKRVYRKKSAEIIPNGVDLNLFIAGNKSDFREELGLTRDKKYILFLGNPENEWKNFILAKEAMKFVNNENVELLAPYPVSQDRVVKFLNAADVLIVTSYMEGSSNVIKEAMACNCPIVTTDVGDANWVTGNTAGCFASSFDAADVADKIEQALTFSEVTGRTSGRRRILELGLDSATIAKMIINVYKKALS
jgi:teichuronic acid biosynthesis glycosyltransferase TuaC